MRDMVPSLTRLFFVPSLLLASASTLHADGGALRVRERAGNYTVAVFTSPTPLCAGPVDFSVLVQDAATCECLPDSQVTIRLVRDGGELFEYPATTEVATNKLFRAAVFELPAAGWWNVHVAIDGPRGTAGVHFMIEAAEPPPRWLELWPWYAWPALAIALFGVHQTLVRRKVQPHVPEGGAPASR